MIPAIIATAAAPGIPSPAYPYNPNGGRIIATGGATRTGWTEVFNQSRSPAQLAAAGYYVTIPGACTLAEGPSYLQITCDGAAEYVWWDLPVIHNCPRIEWSPVASLRAGATLLYAHIEVAAYTGNFAGAGIVIYPGSPITNSSTWYQVLFRRVSGTWYLQHYKNPNTTVNSGAIPASAGQCWVAFLMGPDWLLGGYSIAPYSQYSATQATVMDFTWLWSEYLPVLSAWAPLPSIFVFGQSVPGVTVTANVRRIEMIAMAGHLG